MRLSFSPHFAVTVLPERELERQATYGGQAVLEGVMIRGERHVSVAVRKPSGGIAFRCEPLSTIFTGRLRRLPVLRGTIVLTETMVLGMKALSFSANVGLETEQAEVSKWTVASMVIFSLVLGIGLFFLAPVMASRALEGQLRSDLLTNLVEGLIRLAVFLGYVILIGRLAEIRRVYMYHGAEHMTVHAQERGEKLNVDTVRKYQTAHPRCGTAFLLIVMVVAVAVFVFVGRDPFWWLITSRVVLIPIIAGFSYEVIRLSGRYAGNPLIALITTPSLALQALTTQRPEDDQIEVAIAAMNQAIAADKNDLSNAAV